MCGCVWGLCFPPKTPGGCTSFSGASSARKALHRFGPVRPGPTRRSRNGADLDPSAPLRRRGQYSAARPASTPPKRESLVGSRDQSESSTALSLPPPSALAPALLTLSFPQQSTPWAATSSRRTSTCPPSASSFPRSPTLLQPPRKCADLGIPGWWGRWKALVLFGARNEREPKSQ